MLWQNQGTVKGCVGLFRDCVHPAVGGWCKERYNEDENVHPTVGGWCKERYNEDENNKLEGLHQKLDQMEETRWEGQNFPKVVAPPEEEEKNIYILLVHSTWDI